MLLIRNANIATMSQGQLNERTDHALIADKGRITWIGSTKQIPPQARPAQELDAQGAWLLPGFIECHTHLIYAGCRTNEFADRLTGRSYQEICQSGGGILSTVQATRAASPDQLLAATTPRLNDLIRQGVTTIDLKSGYGLNLESELKILNLARKIPDQFPIKVITGLLAAHTTPPEFSSADDYIDHIIETILPAAIEQNLADYVDCFTESIGFSPDQTRRLFQAAKNHNLKIRIHADQLSNLEGAGLAAEFKALSADHVEYTSELSAQKMADAGTVAVLLPTAFYYLKETQMPPIDAFRRHGVPLAVSTDSNPGTSPSTNLLLALNMASTLFGLTIQEALLGATANAAKALGIADQVGSLELGKQADLALWAIDHPNQLVGRIQSPPLIARWLSGIQTPT
jgi:imidazolonepropionase